VDWILEIGGGFEMDLVSNDLKCGKKEEKINVITSFGRYF
jgi:hypothetical protein